MGLSRRGFLKLGMGTMAAAAVPWSAMSSLGQRLAEAAPAGGREARVLADLHVHLMVNEWNLRTPLALRYPGLPAIAERLVNVTGLDWKECHKAGVDMLVAAHLNAFDEWLSMPTDPDPEASAHTHRMLDLLEREMAGPAAPYAALAKNHLQLDELLRREKTSGDYRIAVVHGLEGGHALGGNLQALEGLAHRGVAVICITHFFHKGIASAANSFPFFPDAGSRSSYLGLSEFGSDVISEMERLGIIVDITHAAATSVSEILDAATRPLVATHTSARTLGDHPYSLYDEHIQEIAHRGGIVGVIVYPYILSNYASLHLAEERGALRDVVRTIRHVVKITGTHRQVGVGTDFMGYITGPRDMRRVQEIRKLRTMLLEEFGHDTAMVEDILAGNVIRFFGENWRSGA